MFWMMPSILETAAPFLVDPFVQNYYFVSQRRGAFTSLSLKGQ